MQDIPDPKQMAKALRRALADRDIKLGQKDCLELVARQFGLDSWALLAARMEAENGAAAELTLPDGWSATNHDYYRLGLDPSFPGTVLIACRYDWDGDVALIGAQFGTLYQSIHAEDYRGQRLRLTASIKTEDAELAAIWMRIDKSPGITLAFDNLMMRDSDGPLSGTRNWTERDVVLDVPPEAGSIHYGFFLRGFGRAWLRNFGLERVSEAVTVTAKPEAYLAKPHNLDFTEGTADHPVNLEFKARAGTKRK